MRGVRHFPFRLSARSPPPPPAATSRLPSLRLKANSCLPFSPSLSVASLTRPPSWVPRRGTGPPPPRHLSGHRGRTEGGAGLMQFCLHPGRLGAEGSGWASLPHPLPPPGSPGTGPACCRCRGRRGGAHCGRGVGGQSPEQEAQGVLWKWPRGVGSRGKVGRRGNPAVAARTSGAGAWMLRSRGGGGNSPTRGTWAGKDPTRAFRHLAEDGGGVSEALAEARPEVSDWGLAPGRGGQRGPRGGQTLGRGSEAEPK